MATASWSITAKQPDRRCSTFIFICWADATSAGRRDRRGSAAQRHKSRRRRHAESRSAERDRTSSLLARSLPLRQEIFLCLTKRRRNIRRAGGQRRLPIARECRAATDDHQLRELLV